MTEQLKQDIEWLESKGASLICNIENKFAIYKMNELYYFFIRDENQGNYLRPWGTDIEGFCRLVCSGNLALRQLAAKSIHIDSSGSREINKSDNN